VLGNKNFLFKYSVLTLIVGYPMYMGHSKSFWILD
jgi:hypothetical protein